MTRGYAPGPCGQVPLVMIHQAPMTSRQFENVYAPLLALGIRPIQFVEPPGGDIDIPDQQPDAWSDAVARFIRA